jgi:nitroreductase
MESLIKALTWREATKQFDVTKKLSDTQLDTLLEAARLSPSSYGLQFWSFVVVNNPEVRAKLREASWNQAQITDASQVIVFAAKQPTDELVDAYIADTAATRGVALEALAGYSQMMKGAIANMSESGRLEWAKKQTYIALGVTLTSAAVLGIDACPMEGFDAEKYNEILGLKERGLHATVVLAVGFRSEEEAAQESKKVRFAKKDVVIEI